ncbi:MAG: hypothetical protein IPI45_06820 [Saprospiraceae bacterium]|nr:hypothetical protein [Saprospiraceae bacterium]MBK7737472.1 hypothetical protein [Saprospiraceae bacterium]MBK7913948.1 hypothetical protein [Saprospiraceae bacterium]
MKKIIFYLLLLGVMGGISCNKDTTATNVQSALSDKKWMLVSIKVNGLDVTNDFLDTCDLDNFNVYATNNILELHQGIIKCDVSDPDILYTNWKLLGNDKFIEQDSVIYYLTHLDENNLILGFSDFVENIKYRKF